MDMAVYSQVIYDVLVVAALCDGSECDRGLLAATSSEEGGRTAGSCADDALHV